MSQFLTLETTQTLEVSSLCGSPQELPDTTMHMFNHYYKILSLISVCGLELGIPRERQFYVLYSTATL